MRKLLLLTPLLVFMPHVTHAAIAQDSSASSTGSTSGSSVTLSITNQNAGEYVNVCIDGGLTGTPTVSSVTIGGATAVQMYSKAFTNQLIADYALPNIGSGAQSVVVNTSASQYTGVSVVSYSGVDTVTGWDATSSYSQTSGGVTFENNLTPGHANDWVLSCGDSNNEPVNATIPTGGAIRSKYLTANSQHFLNFSDTNAAVSQSTAEYGQTLAGSNGAVGAMVNIAIFPVQAAPTVTVVLPIISAQWW